MQILIMKGPFDGYYIDIGVNNIVLLTTNLFIYIFYLAKFKPIFNFLVDELRRSALWSSLISQVIVRFDHG